MLVGHWSRRRATRAFTRTINSLEPMERRIFLSGGPEPVTLLDELVLPGDLQVGAAPFAQYEPYIASGPEGTSLAVWSDYRTGGHPNLLFGANNGTMADIWAARIAADGSLIDHIPLAINNDPWHQRSPKATWNGSEWLISWSSSQDASATYIHAARLNPDGQLLDPAPILIMDDRYLDQWGNPTNPEGPLDVQPNGDGFLVTWSRPEPSVAGSLMSAHFATRVDADGTVSNIDGTLLRRGPSQNIFWLGLTYSPSNGGQYLQSIYQYQNSSLLTARRAMDLSPIDGVYTATPNSSLNVYQHKFVGSPAGWMLAYRGGGGAQAVRIGAGNQHLDTTPLNIATLSGDPKVSAAFDGNDYVFTYTQNYNQLWGRRVSTAGVPAAPVLLHTLGNPAYSISSSGLGAGRYSVLIADSTGGMTDIAVINVAADDSTSGLVDVSNAARSHTAPRIASDGTNSLAVFRSFNADEGAIKGVRLTPTGDPVDAEPFTIVPNSLNPGAPNIVFLDGRYVVIFKGNGPAGNILYGQQLSTAGQLIGSPVALTGGMGNGEASVLGNRLLVSGLSSEGLLHRSFRFARVFDENLVALTDRINLSYGFTGSGDVATVGGRWLLTYGWKSTHDHPRTGIAFAFVAPDGTATVPETLVSTYPDNGGVTVVSAGENADEAMIIFRRFDLPPELGGPFWFPNSNEGLVGQRMGADGTRIGPLITLVDEAGNSDAPRAIFDGSNYVLTWVDTRNGVYPKQEVPDVFAARVAIDGTVLDPGGFAVAARHAPEDSVVAVAGAGRTYFAYRSFRYEHPWASYRITTRLLDDVHAPTTSGAPVFNIDGSAPPTENGPTVVTSFWERLYGISAGSLVFYNATSGQTIDPASLTLAERSGAGGRWEYDWIHNGGALPDGNYTATLPAGSVLDKAGNPLAADVTFTFAFLNGDANGDGVVNLADFNILAANFGQSDRTFSEGDFNYDGVVNLADFNLLAEKFGVSLPPPSLTVAGRPHSGMLPFGTTPISGSARTSDDPLTEILA